MDPERARELLRQERSRIEAELARLAPEAGEPDPGDRADAGDELFERERDEGLAEALRERLRAIERAERRLEEGTYGLSGLSGKPIPDERLEADPAAELTVEEQREVERGRIAPPN
jgi:DnaK suppressor protein